MRLVLSADICLGKSLPHLRSKGILMDPIREKTLSGKKEQML